MNFDEVVGRADGRQTMQILVGDLVLPVAAWRSYNSSSCFIFRTMARWPTITEVKEGWMHACARKNLGS